MNPNVLDNVDVVVGGEKNSEKIRSLIVEAAASEDFEDLLSRAKRYSEPVPSGQTDAPDNEKKAHGGANYETPRLPIVQVSGESMELSFFTFQPNNNRYSPSLTASWHLVGKNELGEQTDRIVLQEHLKQQKVYSGESARILSLLTESMQAYEDAWQNKHKPPLSANLRRFLGSLVRHS